MATSSAPHQAVPLSEALALVLSPSQLGAAAWESGHALTGLPWWASIPATTFAVRGLLLPLSAKAKAASTNVVLLNAAFTQVNSWQGARRAGTRRRMWLPPRQQPHQPLPTCCRHTTPARSPAQARMLAQSVAPADARALGYLRLVRAVYGQLRARHPAPSLAWLAASTAAQVLVLCVCVRRRGAALPCHAA